MVLVPRVLFKPPMETSTGRPLRWAQQRQLYLWQYSRHMWQVFKMTSMGTLTTLHSFNYKDGGSPVRFLAHCHDRGALLEADFIH